MAKPSKAEEFAQWYARQSKKHGISPDAYDPRHKYDYEAAYASGVRGTDAQGHWPSKFKDDTHPNRYVRQADGSMLDTKTDKVMAMYSQEAPPITQGPGGYMTGKPADPGGQKLPVAGESQPDSWKTGAGYYAEAFKSKLSEWAKNGSGMPTVGGKFGGNSKSKSRGSAGGGGSAGPATVGGDAKFGLPNPYGEFAYLGQLIPKVQPAPFMQPSLPTMTF